jgi:imidazolonepropionase-like amidohydrolase
MSLGKIAVYLIAGAALCSIALPGDLAAEGLVLDGGMIHPLDGAPFVGRVVIEEGFIRAAAADAAVPADARRLDIKGLHVYPGLCDTFSTLGLVEVSALAATVDTTEIGYFNPHLRAATAVHPASEVIPVTRANGFTHAVVAPRAGRGGVLPGQASFLHLDGWTVEEMTIEPSIALVIQWPQIRTREFDFTTFRVREIPYSEAKKEAEAARDELRDWLEGARHYARAVASGSKRMERNLELEALSRVLEGEQRVILVAESKRDIEAAVEFAEEEGLRMILAGGRDAWEVKELLAKRNIPVVLGRTQSLPAEEDDPYDRPFRNAGELVAAGVKIAFGSSAGGGFGPGGPHSARTLPYEVAMAVAYGLPAEEGLKALTLYPAQILGMEDSLGTVAAGKIANLIVTDGDPLVLTTQIRHLIINGLEVSTNNRHQKLYEKYRARP